MEFIDLVKLYPRAMVPYYKARSFVWGLRILASALYHAKMRGEKLMNLQFFSETNRNLYEIFLKGRPADYQEAEGVSLAFTEDHFLNVFTRAAREPEKLIWHEDLMPPEIIDGMGLIPLMVEHLPIISPLVATEDTHRFIDASENAGYPGDICTLLKITIGMILEDLLPAPKAIVTTNAPCDSGMTSYLPIEQKMKVPLFRVDLPYDVFTPEAGEYCLKEVRRMIQFLEQNTGCRLDMDRLREICKTRNQIVERLLDIMDLLKSKPSPLGGHVINGCFSLLAVAPGAAYSLKVVDKVAKIAKNNHANGQGPIKEEKYRAVLWNPYPGMFPDFAKWMEDTYQTVIVMDMISFNRYNLIDTSSDEAMMRGLADVVSKGPMARHTRGPAEQYFDDLFRVYRDFQCDMIIMAAHQYCKNTRAVIAMMRNYCRKDNIPLLVFDYDLSDARVVSEEGIKKQVADFMETVMGEKR